MEPPRSEPALALGVLCALGGAYALALYATSFQPDYGYFLDEFYYLACARHLAWGYPDHPALYPALLRLNVGAFFVRLADDCAHAAGAQGSGAQ